jgi:hypothetical protein
MFDDRPVARTDTAADLRPGVDARWVDRFELLLAVASASVVVQSLINLEPRAENPGALAGSLLVTLLVGTTMILALRAAGVRRRRRRPAELFIALTVAFLIVLFMLVLLGVPVERVEQRSPPYFWVALSAVAPVLVVRRLLQHRRVGRQTLFGALSGYLLIAITFGFAFQTTDALQSTPFFGDPQPSTSYIYYSLVTITTTGYGGLLAATELGRLLSVMEAVIGQVYLVTIVAMIVGLLAQSRQR